MNDEQYSMCKEYQVHNNVHSICTRITSAQYIHMYTRAVLQLHVPYLVRVKYVWLYTVLMNVRTYVCTSIYKFSNNMKTYPFSIPVQAQYEYVYVCT